MQNKKLDGFSLVESMVSMVLLSILITGLLITYFTLIYSKNNDLRYQSIKLSEAVMDSVKAFDLKDTFFITKKPFKINCNIKENEKEKSVLVEINWGPDDKKNQRMKLYRKFFLKPNDLTDQFYSEIKK